MQHQDCTSWHHSGKSWFALLCKTRLLNSTIPLYWILIFSKKLHLSTLSWQNKNNFEWLLWSFSKPQSSTEACRIQNTNRSLLTWLEILEQELQNTKKPYTSLFSLDGQKKKWIYEAELFNCYEKKQNKTSPVCISCSVLPDSLRPHGL